ncbi:MAG: hypothetical protein RBS72_08775 [Sedimentisphaerales bacterium]|jgi:hypothetical protein|nr:hypothetical protein [Sedimentisphaerales bacterium]HNY77672.1 hypothetical protein [Sedimentisphaerales bacterium]HOC63416.1 hypothetical protein [Sedimentisphaerales bacterium]HPY48426.1 hypothetical protein [Sedimentisphaerales bacterium]HQA90358.1 hypothetical protein [Sedimentisphaerales bacterium]
MLCERRYPLGLILILVLTAVPLSGRSRAEILISSADSRTILYLVDSDANAPVFTVASESMTCAEPNLVVVTHGWYERQAWPSWMATAIGRRVDQRQWQCGWYDWRVQARTLRPSCAVKAGRDVAGPWLGRRIVTLSKNWRHVHLIGHSAGAWVVNAAAETIARETAAEIHITFLDAYVPDGWDEKALGRLVQTNPNRFWADHYFTRDPLNLTENVLTGAHNVDVTAINPGIRGHLFPWHWYLATVAGRYTTDKRFIDAPVFCRADGVTYGFPRSLEASPSQWQVSLTLPAVDVPVRIRRQDTHP